MTPLQIGLLIAIVALVGGGVVMMYRNASRYRKRSIALFAALATSMGSSLRAGSFDDCVNGVFAGYVDDIEYECSFFPGVYSVLSVSVRSVHTAGPDWTYPPRPLNRHDRFLTEQSNVAELAPLLLKERRQSVRSIDGILITDLLVDDLNLWTRVRLATMIRELKDFDLALRPPPASYWSPYPPEGE